MRTWRSDRGAATTAEVATWATILSLVAISTLGPVRDEVGGAVIRAVSSAVDGGAPGASSSAPLDSPVAGPGTPADEPAREAGTGAARSADRSVTGGEAGAPLLLASVGASDVEAFGAASAGSAPELGLGAMQPLLLAQAQVPTRPSPSEGTEARLRRYEVWFEHQFQRSMWEDRPLTGEEARAAQGKLEELGLAAGSPSGGMEVPDFLRLTPEAEATLRRVGETRSLAPLVDPNRVDVTAAGIPLSFVTKSFTDSVARGRGAIVTGVPLSVGLSTLRGEEIFEDPVVDVGARLFGTVAAAGATNSFGRVLDSTYRIEDVVKFGSSRDLAAMWTAGQVFLGSEVVIPALRDGGVLPQTPLGADGEPEFATFEQWLGEYGPNALNTGLGAIPLTIDAIADPKKTAAQAAWTAGLTFALPTAYSLLSNAAQDPPPGAAGEVVANVGENVTSEAEEISEFWTQLTERPETLPNPVVRLGLGVPVQLTLGSGAVAGDVLGQLTQPQGLVDPGQGLAPVLDPATQQEAARRFGMANELIRGADGTVGPIVADGLADAAARGGQFLTETGLALSEGNDGVWGAAESTLGTLWGLPGETLRIATEDVPQAFSDAAQTLQQVGQEQVDTLNRNLVQPVQEAVTGVGQVVGTARDAVLDVVAPESGPCVRGMRCWGQGAAGIGTVGPAIVGPKIVGEGIVGEGIVGPAIVGPAIVGGCDTPACPDWGKFAGTRVGPRIVGDGGPTSQGEQNYIDAQNQVIQGANRAIGIIQNDPASLIPLVLPSGSVPVDQSQPARARRAAQDSWGRDPVEVLNEGWGCVTNPAACWKGPQSVLPGSEAVLVTAYAPDAPATLTPPGAVTDVPAPLLDAAPVSYAVDPSVTVPAFADLGVEAPPYSVTGWTLEGEQHTISVTDPMSVDPAIVLPPMTQADPVALPDFTGVTAPAPALVPDAAAVQPAVVPPPLTLPDVALPADVFTDLDLDLGGLDFGIAEDLTFDTTGFTLDDDAFNLSDASFSGFSGPIDFGF